MKTFFLNFIVLFSTNIFAQQADLETADIEIPITIFDNSGLPNNSRTIFCGIDPMATDSIDSFLGEFWLFCPFDIGGSNTDCIPYDHFEAVLDIPVEPDPNSFEFGSWKDIRYGTIPYSGIKTYSIYYQHYSAATALYISWDFPEGVTGLLQDPFGGVILNYQMPDSGTFTHPLFMQINWVQLIITFQNVTPVEMVSFSTFFIDDDVQLEWTTATETNNSGFEIERASSRTTPRQEGWEKIVFVPGFGTTTETKSYSFVDKNVTTGNYKYRLKQIDFDGSFTYSNEIEVEVDFTPKEFVLYQNYPNPFNPSTTIKFTVPSVIASGAKQSQFVTLKVYDILGNEVATLVNEEKQPGVYEVEFSVGQDSSPDIASGIYFYMLKATPNGGQAGSFSSIKKMVLLK